MKKPYYFLLSFLLITAFTFSQEPDVVKKERKPGHLDISKFKQLHEELPTPNSQHTASGAPGYEYTQQQVDYVMNIEIDEENHKLYGDEVITYHNNSKDHLEYLWLQLDQNMRAPDSKTPLAQQSTMDRSFKRIETFTNDYLKEPFPGGFHLDYVKDKNDKPISYYRKQYHDAHQFG